MQDEKYTDLQAPQYTGQTEFGPSLHGIHATQYDPRGPQHSVTNDAHFHPLNSTHPSMGPDAPIPYGAYGIPAQPLPQHPTPGQTF